MKATHIDDASPDNVRDGVKLAQDIKIQTAGNGDLDFDKIIYNGEDDLVKVKHSSTKPPEIETFFQFVFSRDGRFAHIEHSNRVVSRWAEFEP